jgi:hypothetical protein
MVFSEVAPTKRLILAFVAALFAAIVVVVSTMGLETAQYGILAERGALDIRLYSWETGDERRCRKYGMAVIRFRI